MSETVLLTGISGFIAKHVALRLLGAGHTVRGTVRRLDRAQGVRAALAPHLPPEALARLSFAEADLEADQGWDAAMEGVTALMHTASPFVIKMPKNDQDLIRPAVEGTRRALGAAARAGVRRVVLTSSTVAVETPGVQQGLDESKWADLSRPEANAYSKSKTLAERAAWEMAESHGLQLSTVNPGWVLGPPLDGESGTSIALIARLMRGRDPMLPDVGFTLVDVRDVAEAHLRQLERPQTVGKRYLVVAGDLGLIQMARVLKQAHPDRRIPTRAAPMPILRLLALFDPEIATAIPRVGWLPQVSNARARQELGISFIAPEQALRDSAAWLVRMGKV